MRPETAKPRAGRAPIWGESRGPRPSVNSAPRTPPGASPTGSVWSRAAAAGAWLGTGWQGPRGSGERPSHPRHVGGGHQFCQSSHVRVGPFTAGEAVTGLGTPGHQWRW